MECVALSSRCCQVLAATPLSHLSQSRARARYTLPFPTSFAVQRNPLQTLVPQPRYSASSPSRKAVAGTLAEGETANAGPWSVRNDYDQDYVLVSEDADEIAKEIQKVEQENALLRSRLAEVDKHAKETAEGRKDMIDVDHPRLDARPPQGQEEQVVSEQAVASPPAAQGQEEQVVSEQAVAAPRAAQESASPSPASSPPEKAPEQSLEHSTLSRLQQNDKTAKAENPISIVFVTSEVAPYSKTGGLADVIGSLPPSLAARGHRVMVVSPRYMNGVTDHLYKGALDADTRIQLGCFNGSHEVAFFHEYKDGVDWVFVDHPSYHRPGNPYGDTRGAFGDNQFRFTLLCLAACEAPLVLPFGGYTYGEKVLFVANDWHASLVPVYVAAKYRPHGVYRDARTILAIHNLSHQGVEPGVTFSNLSLPPEWYGALEWVFPEWARKHAFDKGEAVNHMKGAIVTSDRLLTVSQGYAWEITTPEGGWGMDGLLRSRASVLNGITNGVDIDDWNPATDKHIASQYTLEDRSGKAESKAALQKELGLPVRPEVPLIGFIGRLDYQKGPDLIQAGLPELMTDDVQFVMLGSGDTAIESWMAWAETTYRDKFRGWVGFSVPVAHRITAGCDILLMPSRFEPCGLNQLYAMRYGTVPVAHSTGGLRDTIETYNPFGSGRGGSGTGWTFSPLTKEAMMSALWTAIFTYRNHPESWEGIIERGMEQDFSWDRAALQYEQVFNWAMMDPPYA